MNESMRKFISGPMTVDLRTQLEEIRRRATASRKHPDLLWRKLCGVIATSGSSVNADRFLSKYDAHLRFDLLPTNLAERTRLVRRLLEEAKVPRMREQKAKDLATNYDKVKSLGGPKTATQTMLSLSGKERKQAWIRQFNGVGVKYSNDIWMDICDPDFTDAIALDARVKSFAAALGFNPKSSSLERDLLEFAKSCHLTGWEFDRLIYNYGNVVLSHIRNISSVPPNHSLNRTARRRRSRAVRSRPVSLVR